jgi:hypothetical protein
MRNPNLFLELQKVWEHYPDLRLGQFLCNITQGKTYFIEDQELLEKLQKLGSELEKMNG